MQENRRIVYVRTSTGCFEVTSHKANKKGYPYINRKGISILLSRFMYEKRFGTIPSGMFIRHKCDNPRCINTDHLEIGTHADNCHDCAVRGRSRFLGERNPNTKLDLAQVKDIKDSPLTSRELATNYGVSQNHIRRIKNGLRWNRALEFQMI